jgi:sialate O-acetylesterase
MEVSAFGPMMKSYIYKDGGMEFTFDYAEGGFDIRGKATGFEIAGADGEFTDAEATVEGEKIFIRSEKVKEPKYARYNWYNYMEVTVFGKNGIPMAPFCLMHNS